MEFLIRWPRSRALARRRVTWGKGGNLVRIDSYKPLIATYILQVSSVLLFVGKLLDGLQCTARSTVEGNTGDSLGGLGLVALVLVHQSDTLAGGILLDGKSTLLDGSGEAGLVETFTVQWIGAEEVVHATALQKEGGRVPGQEPVQVARGVDNLDHFVGFSWIRSD